MRLHLMYRKPQLTPYMIEVLTNKLRHSPLKFTIYYEENEKI